MDDHTFDDIATPVTRLGVLQQFSHMSRNIIQKYV